MRGQFTARVGANVPLCRDHFKLILELDEFPATRPGQFVQLACDDPVEIPTEAEWPEGEWPRVCGQEITQREAFLRRPFSLAGRRDTQSGVELSIIHRIVGVGTGWMSRLREGQALSLIGPLGNGFTLPREDQTAILVGGGVGIPPMLYWAEALKGRKAVAICGALSGDLLPLRVIEEVQSAECTLRHGSGRGMQNEKQKTGSDSSFCNHHSAFSSPSMCIEEFAECGIPSIITTDDGSLGMRGFVTATMKTYLDANQEPAVIYTCGPEPMMKAVAAIALERNIECQVAVERAMACGMGTCQSCVIRVKKPDASKPPLAGSEWCYRLACTDGPIFRAADLLW